MSKQLNLLEEKQEEKKKKEDPERKELASNLTSHLQKTIRRCEAKDAVKSGLYLWEVDREKLLRRLPVITAEDCSWKIMADTVEVCRLADWRTRQLKKLKKEGAPTDQMSGLVEMSRKVIARFIKRMAEMTKCKNAGWIFNVARWRRQAYKNEMQLRTDWEDLFRNAVEERDEIKVAAVLDQAKESYGYDRIYDIAQELAAEKTLECVRAVDACRYRHKMGLRGDAEIVLGAAILALCKCEKVDIESEEKPEEIAWYSLDSHTALGRSSLRIIAKRLSLDYERLRYLQFFWESAKLGKVEGNEYEAEAHLHVIGEKFKIPGMSPAQIVKQSKIDWEKLAPQVRKVTESLRDQRKKN